MAANQTDESHVGEASMTRANQRSADALAPQLLSTLNILLWGSVLPLFWELPLSVIGFISFLFATHLGMIFFSRSHLPKSVLVLLTLGGIGMVLAHFHTLFGYQAGIALFSLMLGLKLFELRTNRDFYISVILGFVLIICQFLLNQSMYLAVYLLFVLAGLVTLLIDKNAQQSAALRPSSVKLTGMLLLQSIPIVFVLFLLFPRLSTPLWSIHLGSKVGVTGLSESMELGSISQLVSSNEAAFRVEFLTEKPIANALYWRGPVLWRTNGKRWFPREKTYKNQDAIDLHVEGAITEYRLILEPHGKKWMLPLDLPIAAPPGTHLNRDFELLNGLPINTKKSFLLKSTLGFNNATISHQERLMGLQLPGDVTDRMRALVEKWQNNAQSERQIVTQALTFFHRQAFVYTLSPPPLYAPITDRFLFETRAGFCEHYASTFTLLMRLAGMPSRVVTGYLGGEYNEVGDYLLVRQRDAHAWSEVWLEGEGWVRIDPTAAIAPERVERQISFDESALGSAVNFRLRDDSIGGAIARRLRLTLDALNTRWHIWVLGYDAGKQKDFLRWLGMDFLTAYEISILMIGTGVFFVFLTTLLMTKYPGSKKISEAERIYQQFCLKLEKIGIRKMPQEGESTFSQRVAQMRPDLRNQVNAITLLYLSIHYGGRRGSFWIKTLRGYMAAFKPKRRKNFVHAPSDESENKACDTEASE
jgi:transglutaminase-like putative cysteine protease